METLVWTAIRFGLDVTWKATLLLALALCLMAALQRASAAFRHLASALGLAGVLALPLVTLLVPRVTVPLAPLVPSLLSSAPSKPGAGSLVRARVDAPGQPALPPGGEAASAAASNTAPRSCSNISTHERPAWPLWAITIWASGVLLASLRLVFGMVRVRAIVRKAEPLSNPGCLEAVSGIVQRLGLDRRVRVLTSPEVPVAMTVGVLRPVLLLNSSAPEWPEDLRRAVLLHELAHVRRWDWITLLLGELAVAFYWFHPLAWLARRETRLNAERACDDRVIGDGTQPSAYAAHLLDIVRSFAPGNDTALPAMAMARPSQFEGRVRAILDPDRRRRELNSGQVRTAAVGLLAAVGAIAAIAPSAARNAGGATVRLAIAPVPLAIALPSVSEVSAAPPSAKTECKTKPARTAAKGTCRKKPAGASAQPRVSS
ncbi:MAG TPA: M56 family metallopeptidase [Thermoanaerobaculia bacterium]